MRLRVSGIGAGTADPPHHRNVTRVLVGESLASATISEDLVLVETTVDDLEPRLLPGVLEATHARHCSAVDEDSPRH